MRLPQARRLSISVTPDAGESWDSYLTRVANANATTVQVIADATGIRQDGRWPPFHGVTLMPGIAERAADCLGISSEAVADMHLAHYDGIAIDLSDLGHGSAINAARSVATAGWVYLAGSHYCPACLNETGIWRLEWRLPWLVCCLRHRVVLASRCPTCRAMPRSGKSSRTCRPVRPSAQHDGRQCTQPHPHHPGSTCLAPLGEIEAATATPAQLRVAEAIDQVLHGGRNSAVIGMPQSSLACVRAWQTAACYAHAFGAVTVDRQRWNPAKRWSSPPRDAAVTSALLVVADQLVGTPNADAAADVLADWCRAAQIKYPTPATFRDIAPPCPALQPAVRVLLCRVGRAHSIVVRSLEQLDGQQRILVTDFEVDDVPQLVWPCVIPRRLPGSRQPGEAMIRAVVSLTLARIAGARTWAQAGEALGWTPAQGKQWSRYTFRASNSELRQAIVAVALNVAPQLAGQPHRHQWAQRPRTSGPTRHQLRNAQRPSCNLEDPAAWCPCVSSPSRTQSDRLNALVSPPSPRARGGHGE